MYMNKNQSHGAVVESGVKRGQERIKKNLTILTPLVCVCVNKRVGLTGDIKKHDKHPPAQAGVLFFWKRTNMATGSQRKLCGRLMHGEGELKSWPQRRSVSRCFLRVLFTVPLRVVGDKSMAMKLFDRIQGSMQSSNPFVYNRIGGG